MLDRLAHMRRAIFLALGVLAAGAAAAAIVVASRSTQAVGTASAAPAARLGARMTPHVPLTIRSAADARASVARSPFAAELGLTAEELADTSELYRFDGRADGFTAGLSAYSTPLARGGFCIAFAVGVSCSRTPPTAAEPLIGIALDPDAERAGEPFVVISIAAPGVRSVTYTCAGSTYPAKLADGVVVFISPSSSLRADDCTGNTTFASGAIVSKRV
jgi:hypothetical protein